MFFTTNELISLHRGAQGHGLSVQTKRIIFVVLLMHSCRGVAKAQTTNEPMSTKAVVLLRTRIIFIRLIQQLQSRVMISEDEPQTTNEPMSTTTNAVVYR